MILVPIALIIVVSDLMQFAGRVTLHCVCTDIDLDGIINNLQCCIHHVKKAMNRLLVYAISFILSLK